MGQPWTIPKALLGILMTIVMIPTARLELGFQFSILDNPDEETTPFSFEHILDTVAPDLGEPEVFMTTDELATSKGYPCEIHHIQTEDGFILTLHRIPYGVKDTHQEGHRPVVFLQHGLLEGSADFLLNLANQSLAFILADAGADVWLGNMRGNMYSADHVTLRQSDPAYWNWTFDEIAKYDIPAMMNHVISVTGQRQIYYVGFSLGCGVAFIESSRDVGLAAHIRHFFALAPATRLKYTQGVARSLTVPNRYPSGAFVLDSDSNNRLLRLACEVMGYTFCKEVLFQVAGRNEESFNMSRVPVYIGHLPQATSLKNVVHELQLISSGEYQQFDEGSPANNMARYGQTTPPFYDLSTFNIPTTIFYGGNDKLVDKEDVDWLMTQIPVSRSVFVPHYNHLDFMWGLDAPQLVYQNIIETIFDNVEN